MYLNYTELKCHIWKFNDAEKSVISYRLVTVYLVFRSQMLWRWVQGFLGPLLSGGASVHSLPPPGGCESTHGHVACSAVISGDVSWLLSCLVWEGESVGRGWGMGVCVGKSRGWMCVCVCVVRVVCVCVVSVVCVCGGGRCTTCEIMLTALSTHTVLEWTRD